MTRPFPSVSCVLLCSCCLICGRCPAGTLIIDTPITLGPGDASMENQQVDVVEGGQLKIEGGHTFQQLLVEGTVEIDGDAELAVMGQVRVTDLGVIRFLSVANDGMVEGVWAGHGGTLTAGSMEVAFGGHVSADGTGYKGVIRGAGLGPGGGAASARDQYAGGGGYGGAGADRSAPGGLPYGSYRFPADLGSAGGAETASSIYPGASGGGAIRLIVSGSMVLEGTISADGAWSDHYYIGSGSGGSIWATVGSLSGAGVFRANGGKKSFNGTGGAGGGGRIAVYCGDDSAYTGTTASVCMGGVEEIPGAPGTIGFFNLDGTRLKVFQTMTFDTEMEHAFTEVVFSSDARAVLGGGATLVTTGSLDLRDTARLTIGSIDNGQLVDGAWVGRGGTIEAVNLSIAEQAAITADGMGYKGVFRGAGLGPGGGAASARDQYAGGGGYGGAGADRSVPGGRPYGSYLHPVDLGSAGGAETATSTFPGSAGGGAIRLIVSGSMVLEGTVSADGARSDHYYIGSGSGGSIWATVGSLSGAGVFRANGGTKSFNGTGGAGGGGRIAVYCGDDSAYAGATASVCLGGAEEIPGAPGTIGFFNLDGTRLDVFQTMTFDAESEHTFVEVVLSSDARVVLGGGATLVTTGSLALRDTARLTIDSIDKDQLVDGAWVGRGGTIEAVNLSIAEQAAITADGMGYKGRFRGAGMGPGGGAASLLYLKAGGGGYGGAGGDADVSGGGIYGSYREPLELGSAGGAETGSSLKPGASGGGAVRLLVTGTLELAGRISADGSNSDQYYNGSGSGGSIWATVGRLVGSGIISAAGGQKSFNGPGGGGGGGRLAVYCDDLVDYLGMATCTAAAGVDDFPGEPGTVGFFSRDGRRLVIERTFAFEEEQVHSFDQLTARGEAIVVLGGGARLETSGSLEVLDSATIRVGSIDRSGMIDGIWAGRGGTLAAGSLTVESGASISADGMGYLGMYRSSGLGPGGGAASSRYLRAGGGGYGGKGGDGTVPGGVPYGSLLKPVDLGSAGGAEVASSVMPGAAGGGAIRIICDGLLTLHGRISANGVNSDQYYNGSGSGGSLWVTAGSLAGDGYFRADGGRDAFNGPGGEGGGGRIAVYSNDWSGFHGLSTSTAHGGQADEPGDWGTICFLSADGLRLSVFDRFRLESGEHVRFQRVFFGEVSQGVQHGGSILEATGEMRLEAGSRLEMECSGLQSAPGGHWIGRGSELRAGRFMVEAGAVITAEGKGYPGGFRSQGLGPGGGMGGLNYDRSGGGGYGGMGAPAQAGAGIAYGLAEMPHQPGSGGGGTQNSSYAAAAGGGAILIRVRETADVSGTIQANGGNSIHYYDGCGSGGSVRIEAGAVIGSGGITALGGRGTFNGPGGGGGGGRVAVYTWAQAGADQPAVDVSGGIGTGGEAPGETGSFYQSDKPKFLFLQPTEDLVHGTQRIQWDAAFPDWDGIRVDIRLLQNSKQIPIAAGQPISGGLFLDSAKMTDGVYQLWAVYKNASGQVVGEAKKELCINNSAIWHEGELGEGQIWRSGEVHIVGGLDLVGQAHLVVEAGVVIKFLDGGFIRVGNEAGIELQGTEQRPVVLTSIKDDSAGGDTNFDRDRSIPRSGDWNGVEAVGTGSKVDFGVFSEVRYVRREHSGTLVADAVWDGTYLHEITGDLTLPADRTLVIAPGAVIKVHDGVHIRVEPGSVMQAVGTRGLPIYFTSIHDDEIAGDSNNDGAESGPNPGDWGILEVRGEADFEHVQFRYGGDSGASDWNDAAMVKSYGQVVFGKCLFLGALYDSLGVWGGECRLWDSLIVDSDRGVLVRGGIADIRNNTVYGCRIGLHPHGGVSTIYNTIVSDSTSRGLWNSGGLQAYAYNNIWNSTEVNYYGMTDPTGTNGNISEDPVFKNPGNGSFYLGFGSPCIDHANGIMASESDFADAPRYDDPRSANTGIETGGRAFADLGAFEFVENAESDKDLVVVSIDGPGVVTAGGAVELRYRVANIGTASIQGPWVDRVGLVAQKPERGVEYLEAGIVPSGMLIGPGDQVECLASVTVPGGTEGEWRWQVQVNSGGDVFEGIHWRNNVTVSENPTTMQVPRLGVGGEGSGEFSGAGEDHWFSVVQPAGVELVADLDTAMEEGRCSLFVGYGSMPVDVAYDLRSAYWHSPDVRVGIPAPQNDRLVYFLVRPEVLTSGPIPFVVHVGEAGFELTGITCSTAGNAGELSFGLIGSGFVPEMVVRLERNGGLRTAHSLILQDSSSALATVDLMGAQTGAWDVVIELGGVRRRLEQVLNVVTGIGGRLATRLVLPERVRAGRTFTGFIYYENTGDSNLEAPLFEVLGYNGNVILWETETFSGELSSARFLGVSQGRGLPSILAPGEGYSIAFEAVANMTNEARFKLFVKDQQSTEPMDLSALESLVIPDVECDCWEQAWQLVRSTCGSTVGSYIGVLTAAADRAAEFGLDLISERAVLTFMVREAAQTLESPILAGRILPGPGLSAGERLGVHLLPTDVALEDAEPIYTTLTWYDGTFGFSDILPGRYDLVVDGFARDPSWTFTIGGADSDPLIGLELVPQAVAATVAGRITDGIDGPGIPEVAVYLSGPTRPVRTTISDEAGIFRFSNVALGDYSLWIVPVGWVPVSPVALSLEPGASVQHHFSLSQSGGMIRGSVFDPEGEPVQGACVDVRLRGTPGSFGLWEGTTDLTDEYGGFFFPALPAGSFELIASKAGYAPSAGHLLRVQAGDLVSQVALQLREGGVLTGTVRDTSGQPLAQALVTVSGSTGSRCVEAVSDMFGEFRLEHLPLELVRITATLDGYAPAVLDQWITAPAISDVELMLPGLGQIEGTVARQGVGLKGIYVTLVGEDGVHQWVETDALGRFVFEGLLEGGYVVMLGHSGGLSAGRTEVMIDAGHQTQAVVLEASCSLLSGRLLAADQHTPQAGGVVGIVLNGEVLDSREVAWDGMFSFVVLEPGLYEFVARSDSGLYAPRQVMIEANTDSVMADWVPGMGDMEITIIDAESASAVAGAAVYLEWPLDDFGFMTLAEATDQAGVVHFSGLPEGEYRFAVHADGYPVARGGGWVESGAGVETVPMMPGNTISGVVHYEGLPVDDASVEFVSDPPGAGGQLSSSSDGSFETSLGTGSYDVVAYAVGGSGVWRTEDWFVKGPRGLDIEMTTAGAADVGGSVMDALGNPVWDAQVLVRLPGAGIYRAVRTDLDGAYLVIGLPVGEYVIEATSTGYNSARVELLMEGGPQENVDLAMSAPLVLVQSAFEPATKATAPLGAVATYWPDWLTSKFWRDVTDGTYGMRPPRHFWDMLNADQRLNEYMDYYMSLDIYTQSCYLLQPKFKACMAADDRVRQAFDNWNDHYRLLQEVNVANLRVVAGQSALLGAKTAKLLMDISGMLSKLKGFGTSVSKDRIERINWYMERLTGAAGAIQGAPTKWDLASNASYTNGVLNELVAYLKELKRYQGVNTPFLDLINNVLGLIGDYQALASDYENLDKDALREFQRYQDDAHVFVESIKALHTAFREMKASAKLCNQEDGSDTNPAPTGLDEDDSADAEGGTGVVGSEDPNDKLTTGFGGQGFVDVDAPIHYTIRFENKSDATAPAQRVLITDQLSSDLDWTSLELGEVGFNREVVPVPAGLTRFHTSGVHVLTDPNPVKVDARLDFNAGMITWVIESVDSVTGDLPEDPLAGFLPPNNELHVGDGYVRYSIKPRADLVDGTIITNEANIFFDYNAPINTPSTINTIDRAAPESWILGLGAQSWSRIHVQWGGTDIGTGIHRYDVYVTIDGGAPELWLKGTTETSAIYLGEAGRTYEFWTIAYDALGHSEAPKSGSEHETTVIGFEGRIRAISSTSTGMLLLGFDQLRPGLGYSLERSISWPVQEWVPSGSFVPQAESYETTIQVPLDMESGFFRLAPP